MSRAWLYQMMSDWEGEWTPEDYRREVWESEPFPFQIRGNTLHRGLGPPRPGDAVFFMFCKTLNDDPGIFGVGKIVEYDSELGAELEPPSDRLKKRPLWDSETESIINTIRGPNPKGFTMFIVLGDKETALYEKLRSWVRSAK